VLPLTAREAVNLSLNHNLDLEVARYQPWIEEQNVFSAFGAWDHVAYAGASGSESISKPSNSLIDATRPETDVASASVGVRKALPFGASYDLSLRTVRVGTNNPYAVFDPRWTQSADLAVTIPLLRGFGESSGTATLVVARASRDAAVDSFEKTLGDSVYQVLQAHGDLVFAIESKKVKDQSLEVALRLLEDNRQKFARDLVAKIDVTQADAGVASQREGILTAEAAVQNAADRLKRLVDPSLLREAVTIVPFYSLQAPGAELDERAAVQEALARALERRPEFAQLRHQRAGQEAELARAGSDLLPQLNLTGSASLSASDNSLPDASRDARSGDFRDLSVGLVFEWPLEGSSARGAWRRAELAKRRLDLQLRNLENQVLVEVREAVRSIKTNEQRIAATRRARELAQEQLDGEMTRRNAGLSTTFRVLDVQEDLALARTNELKALLDYGLSRHRLDQVTGMILERHGIVLRDNLHPRLPVDGR
jgi:outer membrane protein TolC